MSSNLTQRVEAICHAALELSGQAREAFVREACENDEIRKEVEELLAHATAADGFLAEPLGAVAAKVMHDANPSGKPRLARGTQLGLYEVITPLGVGGMGEVYRARDLTLARDVALKVLSDRTSDDATLRERLLREARRAASLSHSGICQVFHVGESPTAGPFIVMELVEGQTLHAALRSGPMSIERVCPVGRAIAEALEYAHAHGVVHRDLKSANVMLTSDGRVKVLDFGLAALLPDGNDERTLSAIDMQSRAGIVGTLPYMAPEVLQGRDAGIATDLWALGVVLYEMATGHLPFSGGTPSELIATILRDPPTPLPAETPPSIAHVIRQCLSKEPAARPGHAGEVALALDVASQSTHAPSPVKTRSLVRVAAFVVAVAGLSAVIWTGRTPTRFGTERPLRLQKAVQLTSAVGVEEAPAWSPDGLTIAYAASPGGSWAIDWDIWITQPGGTPVNRTADYAGKDLFPSWSPDGRHIAFWSDRDGGGCYVMPAFGGAARRVAASSLYDPNPPVWSRSGRELSCVVGDAFTVELVTFAVDTGEPLRRLTLPGDGRRMFVSPSPDWSRLAMIVSPAGLASDLTRLDVLDVGTGKAEPLTDGQTNVWSPSWLADGSSLLYVSNAGGSADLWQQRFDSDGNTAGEPVAVSAGIGMRNLALSSDGGKLAYAQGRKVANLHRVPILANRRATWADATQITFDQAFVEFADLSPDGQRLAVSSDRAGSFDLWVLPSVGGEMRQITFDRGAEFAPKWSPDGQTFAFYSLKSGNRDIWTMPVVGGVWKQLTDNPGPDLIPAWSPDGSEIVYLSGRGTFNSVWVTSVAGSAGREIARTEASSGHWSRDGQQIAFVVNGRLARRAATGHGAINELTRGPAVNGIWAPDGARLYFAGGGDRRGDIYTVRADGTGERALTDFRNRRGMLVTNSLATDGRYLYFSWQEDLGDLWIAEIVK